MWIFYSHLGGPYLRVGNNESSPTTVDEGTGSFTVDCTVTQSVPAATIYLIIRNGSPMDITNNPIRTFSNVNANDAGTYECRASSGQAITTYTYTLIVNGKGFLCDATYSFIVL